MALASRAKPDAFTAATTAEPTVELTGVVKPAQREKTSTFNQEAATDKTADPVISISIGQVEVVTTTGKTDRPRPPARSLRGVMTLDEYLRQRGTTQL